MPIEYEHAMMSGSAANKCVCGETFDTRSDLVDHVAEEVNDG